MCSDRKSKWSRRLAWKPPSTRAQWARKSAGRADDSGLSLIEVVVAFVVLLIAILPLSYLFTTSLISAGQSTNQQTALSIAEAWAETLANTTPPVTASSGAVVVNTAEPPAGPAPTFTPPTVTFGSNNKALDTVSTINVTSTTNFANPVTSSGTVPPTALSSPGPRRTPPATRSPTRR